MMVLTAARPKGRQAAVLLTYEKTDISEEIAPDLESFKYTDVAESKSDSVSITVNAKAAKWKNDWMPEKGVKLYPAIVVKDWNIGGIESGYRDYSAECGAFVLDDLSFAGAPDSLTMGFDANLLKLLSASVVAVFLAVPYWKGKYFSKPVKKAKEDAKNA